MSVSTNILVGGILPEGRWFNLVNSGPIPVQILKERIYDEHKHMLPCDYFLTSNGEILEDDDIISTAQSFVVIRAHLMLLGGKGGFGTLIRSMGTQINKGSRKGACRDLSGRRMRDVEAEKKMAKWMAQEPERRKKSIQDKKNKLERKRTEPKHYFKDTSYMDQIRSTEDNIGAALEQGMQAASSSTVVKGTKRKLPEQSSSSSKKQKIWLGIDDDSESEDVPDCESRKLIEGIHDIKQEVDKSAQSSTQHSMGYNDIAIPDNKPDSDIIQGDKPSSIAVDVETAKSETSDVGIKDHIEDDGIAQLKIINIEEFSEVEDLMSVDGDILKYTLQSMDLKCGGTIAERAQRLFAVKGKTREEIDPSLFVKSKKKSRKK